MEDTGQGRVAAEACEYPPPEEFAQFDYNVIRQHVRRQFEMKSKPISRRELHFRGLKVCTTYTNTKLAFRSICALLMLLILCFCCAGQFDGARRKERRRPAERSDVAATPSDSAADAAVGTSSDGDGDEAAADVPKSKSRPAATPVKETRANTSAQESLIDPVSDDDIASDAAMQEYIRVKAQRKKKGTLKRRLH